jgi:very-short-patch-repair endonuclease
MATLELDRHVAELASRQYGIFSLQQLRAVGATRHMIASRLRSGAWIQICAGVYALPSHPPTWHRQLKAAELSKARAVVSGKAAAALHGLPGFKPGRPEITVPPGTSGRCPIATVHRSSFVEPVEIAGILSNSLRQVYFDVAGKVSSRRLSRAVDDGLRRGLVTTRELTDRCLDLAPTRLPGLPAMRALLMRRGEDYVPPTSELERLLYDLLDQLGEQYERQASFPWRTWGSQMVDALLPRWRLIVEADGRHWHSRFDDFANDRARDRDALLHGYRTVRYDYWTVRDSPTRVLRELRQIGQAPHPD